MWCASFTPWSNMAIKKIIGFLPADSEASAVCVIEEIHKEVYK